MIIERIELHVIDLPQRLQRQFFSGSWDTGAPGDLAGKPILLKMYCEGVVGLGQIRPIAPGHFMPDTVRSVLSAISDVYAPQLIGRHVFDIASISHMFDMRLPGNANARALVDHALHDALGKALGLPVYQLLGGATTMQLPLEWSVSYSDDVGVMVAEAERAVSEFGISYVGLKAAGPEGWRRDVENLRTVRSAVGDSVEIGVDPNTGWAVDDAIRAIHAMKHYGLHSIEQPIDRSDFSGLRRIRDSSVGVSVLADESLTNAKDAYLLARGECVDGLVIKLYKVGGLHSARKIAAVAEAANVRVNLGGLAAFSQLEAAAGAHFLASLPEPLTMGGAEFVFGLGVLGPDPIAPEAVFDIVDGSVAVPSSPGLGIEVDEAAIQRLSLHSEIV